MLRKVRLSLALVLLVGLFTSPALQARNLSRSFLEQLNLGFYDAEYESSVPRGQPLWDLSNRRRLVNGNGNGGSFSTSRAAVLEQALKDERTMLERMMAALVRWNADDRRQFLRWFGTTSETARRRMLGRVARMLSLNSHMRVSNFRQAEHENGVFAYVYLNDSQFNIYLDTEFWRAPSVGIDSKAGTLLHEQSHWLSIGATTDVVYGEENAILLARTNRLLALGNADSWEFWGEHTR